MELAAEGAQTAHTDALGPLARLAARAEELGLVEPDPTPPPLLTASDVKTVLATRAADDVSAWGRAQAEWLAMSPAQWEERIALAQAEAWSGAGERYAERPQPIGRARRQDQAAAADLEAKLAAIRASAPPLELRSDPERDPAHVARILELEAQIDRARRTIEFFTSASGTPFDWEAWLRCEAELQPSGPARIAALETALAALISRVRATGGYASPEEQDALWRAEQLLAGAAPPAPPLGSARGGP